jgi:hypothetical protein
MKGDFMSSFTFDNENSSISVEIGNDTIHITITDVAGVQASITLQKQGFNEFIRGLGATLPKQWVYRLIRVLGDSSGLRKMK